jgi:hypothetical protein
MKSSLARTNRTGEGAIKSRVAGGKDIYTTAPVQLQQSTEEPQILIAQDS